MSSDAALGLAGGLPELPARTVFFCSDPAGAKACASLAKMMSEAGVLPVPRVLSNRERAFGPEIGIELEVLDHAPSTVDLGDADLVFCGTSHPASSERFELGAIEAARDAPVRSIAFVDHWTSFRLRFESARGDLVLPDEIWVLDGHAAALAEREGLPRERLRISGSPTLALLARLRRSRSGPRSTPTFLGRDASRPLIVFAPDPITLRASTEFGALNEVSAAADLADALAVVAPFATVLVRLHPLQPAGATTAILDKFAARGLKATLLAPTLGIVELCEAADVLVGFYSNVLLEAQVLGIPVVRYLPDVGDRDPLLHLDFGRKVTLRSELLDSLRASLDDACYEPPSD